MRIEQGVFKLDSLDSLVNWKTISGFQFENLVVNSKEILLEALNLKHTTINAYGEYHQTKTSKRDSCQIDLLIETKRSLYFCEVKQRKIIGKNVITEIDNKITTYKKAQKTSGFNIYKILIYSGELSQDLLNCSEDLDWAINFEDYL